MKVVCLSDTHGFHRDIPVPSGKVVVHTGDFSNRGSELETDNFLEWYAALPHQHKILVAGNHDWYAFNNPEEFAYKCFLLGVTYLNDSSASIDGIKFYGTPWVPKFFDWAFMKTEAALYQDHYRHIPTDTQVLLTHGPALSTLDKVPRGHVGSSALASVLTTLPKLTHHIFGHIHEGSGKKRGNFLSINAACVDRQYGSIPPKSVYIKHGKQDTNTKQHLKEPI